MLDLKNKINLFLHSIFFEKFIIFLILINLIVFVLQTDSFICKFIGKYLNVIEYISMIIFSVEYILRVVALKKIKDIFSIYMIIDLLAILPFYLSFIPINIVFLRLLRLMRLFRIAKITRYVNAISNIKQAFITRKNELIITSAIFLIAVFISSTFIYFAEYKTGSLVFRSIPSSFWWAIVTITTVGYGDAYPITFLGKIIASFTAIFGVGLHGLVIGVISSALIDVVNIQIKDSKNI